MPAPNTLKMTGSAALKNFKYLRVNLIEGIYNLYIKSYKTLLREIKEILEKWRGTPKS
jgi:hypothetical protein